MYTLTNMITDPEFTKGHWSGGISGTVDGYSCGVLVGSTGAIETVMTSKDAYYLDNTHIYYMRYYTRHPANTSSEWESLSTQCYWPIAEPYFTGGNIGPANTWKMISGINTRSSFSTGNHELRLDWNNEYHNFPVFFSRMMLIDLTEAFGDDAPSITEEMMDLFPFFTNTFKVPSIYLKKNNTIYIGNSACIKNGGNWEPIAAHQLYKKVNGVWVSEVPAPLDLGSYNVVGNNSLQTLCAFDATGYDTLSFDIQIVKADGDRLDGYIYLQDSTGTNTSVTNNLSDKPLNWNSSYIAGLGWTGKDSTDCLWTGFEMNISKYTGNCKILVNPATGYSYKLLNVKVS